MISAASGGDSQVVLLRFGVVADEAAAATELAKITKVGKKAQEELNKGQKIGPIKTDEAEKSLLQYWTRVAREMDRGLADRERKQLAWGAKLAAALDKESKAVENELAKQKGLYEAHKRVVSGALGEVGSAAEKLARGFVLLGVSQEKDLAQAARMLATFEGTISGLKGVYNAVSTLTTAYKALTAAQAAAAAAKGISGAAAAGGAVAGAAGAAGGAAAGGAVAGGGGLAASVISAFTPAVVGLGAAAGALVGAAGAIVMATNVGGARDKAAAALEKTGWAGDETTALGDFLIGNDKSGKQARAATKKTNRMAARRTRADEIDQSNAEGVDAINKLQMAMIDSKMSERAIGVDSARSIDRNSTALSANTDNRRDVENALLDARRQMREVENAGAREQAAAQQNLLMLMEKQKQLEVDRLAINKQIAQEQLDAAKTTRDSLVAQYNAAQQLADKIRDQSRSAEERFGQLDPVQQKRVIEAKKKADAGGELTREESAALRGFTDQADDQARAQDIARGRKFGGGQFADLFLKPNQQNEQSARQMAIDLQTNINTQNEIIVKLEADGATLAQQVTTTIKDIVRQQIAMFKAETEKQAGTDRFEQAERRFAEQAARAN